MGVKIRTHSLPIDLLFKHQVYLLEQHSEHVTDGIQEQTVSHPTSKRTFLMLY